MGAEIYKDQQGNSYVIQPQAGPWNSPKMIPSESSATDMISKPYDLEAILSDLTTKAKNGDAAAQEKLFNYYATQKSEQTARDYTAEREDHAYSRLIKDLESAGISPYIISGASPSVTGYSGASYSGSQLATQENNKRSNSNEVATKIMSLIGTALMYALLFA